MSYPQRADLWHDEVLITSGSGPIVTGYDELQYFNFYSRLTSHSNGDTFTQSFLLDSGTYTFYVLGYEGTNQGKLEWYIDDIKVVTGEDWYGSAVHNVVKTHASIAVVGDGRHVLTGVVNGKNGSSSDYYISLTRYWFMPSVDSSDV